MAQRTRTWGYASGLYTYGPESPSIQLDDLGLGEGETIGHMFLSVTPSFDAASTEGHHVPSFLNSYFGVYVGSMPFIDPDTPTADPGGWLLWDRLAYLPTGTPIGFYESAAELIVYEQRWGNQTAQTRFYESKGQRTAGPGDSSMFIANMEGSGIVAPAAIYLHWALRYLVFSGEPSL